MNDALDNYQDPPKVDGAIAETKAILADKARRDGWSPERLQAATTDRVSKVHTAVINTMLANGDDLTASAYYAKVKDQIAGDDAPHWPRRSKRARSGASRSARPIRSPPSSPIGSRRSTKRRS
jgi:hypothetical protein